MWCAALKFCGGCDDCKIVICVQSCAATSLLHCFRMREFRQSSGITGEHCQYILCPTCLKIPILSAFSALTASGLCEFPCNICGDWDEEHCSKFDKVRQGADKEMESYHLIFILFRLYRGRARCSFSLPGPMLISVLEPVLVLASTPPHVPVMLSAQMDHPTLDPAAIPVPLGLGIMSMAAGSERIIFDVMILPIVPKVSSTQRYSRGFFLSSLGLLRLPWCS